MTKRYNSFVLFCSHHREIYKVLYPEKNNSEITSLLANEWKFISPEEKQKYIEEAKNMRMVSFTIIDDSQQSFNKFSL